MQTQMNTRDIDDCNANGIETAACTMYNRALRIYCIDKIKKAFPLNDMTSITWTHRISSQR